MKTLEHQLEAYGERQRQRHGPITPDELVARRSALAPTFVQEPGDDEPTVDYPRRPHEESVPARPRRWTGAVAAVAAAALVVVGVVVIADGGDRDLRVDAVSAPATSPGVVDHVLGHEWTRAFFDRGAQGGYDAGIHSVTAGGPGLVAVGSVGSVRSIPESDAAVWTSVDGITWTRVPHDAEIFGGLGIQSMEDVTVGGPGLVAVGQAASSDQSNSVAAVWTSIDGVTWSRVPHDPAVFGRGTSEPTESFAMAAVTTGGPGLVAVGHRGGCCSEAAVWTSVDGITWTRVPHDPEVFGDSSGKEGGVSANMTDVIAAGPGLVAVGGHSRGYADGGAAVWTSTDGTTWTRVDDRTLVGVGMTAVTAGGPGLVAVGVGGETPVPSPAMETWTAVVWTSVDGITWTRVPHDEENLGGPGLQWMWDVTSTEEGLVAVGQSSVPTEEILPGKFVSPEAAAVWTSIDGVTWTRMPHDEGLFGTDWMAGVTAGGPGVVAVGNRVTVGAGGLKAGAGPAVWIAQPLD